MSHDELPDDLFESMTSAAPQIPASVELRDSLLNNTSRTIRVRRRMRRAGIAAALAGCYLAGIATMSLRPSAEESGHLVADAPPAQSENGAAAAPRKLVRPEDDQVVSDGRQPAVRLTQYDRLRRAGDQQLEEFGDIPRATGSYQKALQMASAEQRRIAPDRDTWLLMALKQSSNYN